MTPFQYPPRPSPSSSASTSSHFACFLRLCFIFRQSPPRIHRISALVSRRYSKVLFRSAQTGFRRLSFTQQTRHNSSAIARRFYFRLVFASAVSLCLPHVFDFKCHALRIMENIDDFDAFMATPPQAWEEFIRVCLADPTASPMASLVAG